MSQLTVIANITAKPEKADFVKAELEKLIAPTRDEEGCIDYVLHQNNENPANFLMFENWGTRELWQAHLESSHLRDFVESTEPALEDLCIKEMTRLA